MSIFTVDQTKCKKDGICAAECPISIISMPDKESFPAWAQGAEQMCIGCGHCVAVCPQGAISLGDMSPEKCSPVRGELLPGPEQAEHFLLTRRSIRKYKEQPVERELLQRIIQIASYAPSGHNLQPVHWLVIEKKEEIKRLSGMVIDWMRFMLKEKPEFALSLHMDKVVAGWDAGYDKICRGAPHLILAHAPKALPPAPAACTIALAYLELAAYSMGLGACWAGYFGAAAGLYPPLLQALALPEGHQAYGALMIGYPQFSYHRIPLRKEPAVTWR
ncbi:nitroreductase family protein [Desulfocucumis palustris]|nr:nitroreductase family protein [Desulfocucumis palustris]